VPEDSGSRPLPSDESTLPIEIRVDLPRVDWIGAFFTFWTDPKAPRVDGPLWPSVVVVNRHGREHHLLETPSKKEAIAQAKQIRSDFESLGPRAWSQKYDVPWSFVTG
jgi:hypothetical protein